MVTSTPPVVDLPAEPQPVPAASSPLQVAQVFSPIAPPSPPPVPQFNGPAKQLMRAGQPVTQETFTRQTVYGGGPANGVSPSMLEAPGTPKRSMPCIQFMASLATDPNSAEYQIEVHRTGPAIFEGQRIPYGVIERFPPAPYPEIYEQIKQIHGGGSYRIRVLNGEGAQVHQMNFNIDTVMNPPNIRVPNGGMGHMATPGARGPGAFSAVANEFDDTTKLRAEEARLRAEEQKMLTQARVDKVREDIDQARERRFFGPVGEQNRALDTVRSEFREVQHLNDRRFDQMLSNFDKLLLTLNHTRNNGDSDKNMLLIGQMMKAMSDQTTALLTAMMNNGGSKSNELAEAMKMQNESNKQVVTMAIQSATTAAGKSERLLEQLIVHRMEHPDNAVKQALELRESGWKQAMQMWQMLEDYRGDKQDEDVINPEGGFFNNLGNLFLHGLKRLVSGAASGGSGKFIEAVAQMLNKPGATQFSEQELKTVAGQLAREELARKAMSAGQAALPVPASASAPVSRPTPRQVFDRVYETEDQVAQQFQPVMQPVQPVQQAWVNNSVVQPVVQPTSAPTGVIQEVEEEASDGEGDTPDSQLREYVTEAMVMALNDIKAGRKSHDWVDFASDKWNRDFLASLSQASDDTSRIKLLQQYTDPEIFNQIVSLLTTGESQYQNYQNFMENLKNLIQEFAEASASA